MPLNERLKQLRGPMSQAAFAKLVGASQSSIVNYEKGRLPDSGFIESVCNRLGVTADWLLFGTGEQKTGDVTSVKQQHTEITTPEKNHTGDVASFDEIMELNRELRQALREIADLRVEREQWKAERERLLHRIAALEQEAAAAKNGVLPFTAAPAAPDVLERPRGNDVAGEQPTPQSGTDAMHTVQR